MSERKSLLIVFVKNPIEGKVKTRLAATIGTGKALQIYKQLLEHTKAITCSLPIDKIIWYSDYIDYNDIWPNELFYKELQTEGDLGCKMLNAFEFAFSKAYQHVCIIGSDCLELTTEIIQDAYKALNNNDLVIGPAKDGGYFLLGMNILYHDFFQDIQWSTNTVCKSTLDKAKKLKLAVHLLQELSDIDEASDLEALDI